MELKVTAEDVACILRFQQACYLGIEGMTTERSEKFGFELWWRERTGRTYEREEFGRRGRPTPVEPCALVS